MFFEHRWNSVPDQQVRESAERRAALDGGVGGDPDKGGGANLSDESPVSVHHGNAVETGEAHPVDDLGHGSVEPDGGDGPVGDSLRRALLGLPRKSLDAGQGLRAFAGIQDLSDVFLHLKKGEECRQAVQVEIRVFLGDDEENDDLDFPPVGGVEVDTLFRGAMITSTSPSRTSFLVFR